MRPPIIDRFRYAAIVLLLATLVAGPGRAEDSVSGAQYRNDIEVMKRASRGPFRRIRWFCNDGTTKVPEPYACEDNGGGRQHGDWSEATLEIRAAGYPIANVLADLAPEDLTGSPEKDRHLRALLLEQFLIGADDGWILRRARFYRGAFQIEDELAGAQRVLEGLVSATGWQHTRYPLIVEAVRLLPAENQSVSAAAVRGLATAINDQDPAFLDLRTKIHNRPDSSDAAAVRQYATERGQQALTDNYQQLADDIDALYALPDPAPLLLAAAKWGLAPATLRDAANRLSVAESKLFEISLLAEVMAAIRNGIAHLDLPNRRVDALRLVLELEAQIFARSESALAELLQDDAASRQAHIGLLGDYTTALYGLGLLTAFEREQVSAQLVDLAMPQIDLAHYRTVLASLDRIPGWASRRLAFYFENIIVEFEPLEPLSNEFIPDRLRGSPLLVYGRILRVLATDAAILSGARSELFGRSTVTGLRRLNPGLGRGVLRTLADLEALASDTGDSIVIVPQTISELPAVAGIITAQEGNALSHVQLLARNLGIPNVVASGELMPLLLERAGSRVELAASAGGVVRLRDAPPIRAETDATPARLMLDVDVVKLDLGTRQLIPTSDLTQADSGVRVGPKAAQLGELTRRFPGDVSPGLAIPFGVFRGLLDQPREAGGASTFEWMKTTYREIALLDDPVARSTRTKAFLAELRSWIKTTPLEPDVEARMRRQIVEHFGRDGTFGVFVRSDTNIEDLPGFTGAGLNLTVPNVVGVDQIIAAVRRVWASPFELRAYGWRQALMKEPEHVYAAVLLHASVNAEKSGVLITADVDTGSRGYITVVVNEGVGGGVEGQSAETLKVSLSGSGVTLLNPATAPTRRVLLEEGGSTLVPASGAAQLLAGHEIDALRVFTQRVSRWFTNVPEDERDAIIADVEFGFKDGKLILFQIRPFVESKRALSDPYLNSLDGELRSNATRLVNMAAAPVREPLQ